MEIPRRAQVTVNLSAPFPKGPAKVGSRSFKLWVKGYHGPSTLGCFFGTVLEKLMKRSFEKFSLIKGGNLYPPGVNTYEIGGSISQNGIACLRKEKEEEVQHFFENTIPDKVRWRQYIFGSCCW